MAEKKTEVITYTVITDNVEEYAKEKIVENATLALMLSAKEFITIDKEKNKITFSLEVVDNTPKPF